MRKHKAQQKQQKPAELAQQPETRIVFSETGTSGLQEWAGYVRAAYDTRLTWPAAQREYARIRRSMPEMVMVGNAFRAWGRNIRLAVELPDNPSDDDKRYQDFIESDAQNMDCGFGAFLDTMLAWTPFYGWGWWEAPAAVRDPSWTPPNGDTWRSEADDGLIGLRRLAYRDPATFDHWQFDDYKRVTGLWQTDYTASAKNQTVFIPLSQSLHITYGDNNNPEGLSPLEAVYRLERIKYGLEVINGIGFERAAGYLSVGITEKGIQLTSADKSNIASAAQAILTAQQGNYATWPYGVSGEVKDVPFGAAPALLAAIQYYGTVALACYSMQWMALSAMTGAGSYAAMTDSSSMAVFTFNAMLDGFAAQIDAQLGKRYYQWNKASFPGLTRRPRLYLTHIEKDTAISEVAQFIGSLANVMPLGDDDWKAIREKVGFLPATLPEKTKAEQAQDMFEQLSMARKMVQNGRR